MDKIAAETRESTRVSFETLEESATRMQAELFGLADSLGTIELGKIADLVLVDADPLADIANTRRIAGVMLRGQYLDRRALDALLRSVKQAPDRRVNDGPR